MSLEWAVATRARPGEMACGDCSTVALRHKGAVIAVADGLGHGPEAEAAAVAAMQTIEANCGEAPRRLIELCHERLRRTRGAALSVAAVDEPSGTLSWSGVGNVEGVLVRGTGTSRARREAILLRGGIVGYQLPSLHVATCAIEPGDVAIFTTDGIHSSFLNDVPAHESPQGIADGILTEHFRGTDDGLVLVARLTEAAP